MEVQRRMITTSSEQKVIKHNNKCLIIKKNNIALNDAKIAFFTKIIKKRKVLDLGVVQHKKEKYQEKNWLHRAICFFSKEAIGLDIDEDGIAFLEKEGYNVVCADAQDFQLHQEFDVIVAGDIIEHLDNFRGFLSSIKKHMKREGFLAISTPNPFWWKIILKVILRGHATPHEEHTCWFCSDTIRQLLERHGFIIENIEFGSVYTESTVWQKMIKILNPLLPLPKVLKHNTLMILARNQ